jgi:hypothetical protein
MTGRRAEISLSRIKVGEPKSSFEAQHVSSVYEARLVPCTTMPSNGSSSIMVPCKRSISRHDE